MTTEALDANSDVTSGTVTVEVGDERVGLRYFAAGEEHEGPPVVLLHGIGLDAATVSWRHALPALADDRRVFAFDFPGHGESDHLRSYTHQRYLETLDGFLGALDIDRAALAGISMGGGVALGYALDAPERVERLVLVDSYGLGRDAPWRPGGSMLLNVPGFDGLLGAGLSNPMAVAASLGGIAVDPSPGFVADVQRAVGPAAARALGEWQRDEFRATGLKTCYLDRLAEVELPTLLVHGREDPIFPVHWSERATQEIPDARFVAFEACGHWPPREYPEKFNRVVGRFL
ncbi:alpha/beta fold hydrolase [Halococcus hamelinensis]|uniref:Alpha/beta hydrolase fold protein n=3 Tax=Halococcus hamelinensis TaxID=332168 RepID=M0M4L5_9EURY|nr:alpha/beta hydrolase [Halococcus hamelinensis]EMA40631.1 alpha/beta hydrolase fold protein [Halococcus hamelinensis 100A6]